MSDEDFKAVVITPEAWEDVYRTVQPFLLGLTDWGVKHDQPVAVAVGIALGVATVLEESGNACDCEVCRFTMERIADEFTERMLTAMKRIAH